MFNNSPSLPKVVILYGPPAAGKGTQAKLLREILPDFYHLDFGTELRRFVTEQLGDYYSDEIKINPSADEETLQVAGKIRQKLVSFLPVETPDLRFVIEKSIMENLERGMIIEGPGRTQEEAEWISGILKSKNICPAIFHLHLSLSETIKRSATRYYVTGIETSFRSYQEAKASCEPGQEPHRRPEDDDSEGIKQRYNILYADHFAKIISTYQLQTQASVFTLDAAKKVNQVSEDILKYMQLFFDFQTSVVN